MNICILYTVFLMNIGFNEHWGCKYDVIVVIKMADERRRMRSEELVSAPLQIPKR